MRNQFSPPINGTQKPRNFKAICAVMPIVFAAMLVGGCSYRFVPAYSADAAKSGNAAFETISVLLAKGELGALQSSASYPNSVNQYASAISQLETAAFTIEQSNSGRIVVGAEALSSLISNCINLVKKYAEAHKMYGIKPNSGINQPVRVGCDAAVSAISDAK